MENVEDGQSQEQWHDRDQGGRGTRVGGFCVGLVLHFEVDVIPVGGGHKHAAIMTPKSCSPEALPFTDILFSDLLDLNATLPSLIKFVVVMITSSFLDIMDLAPLEVLADNFIMIKIIIWRMVAPGFVSDDVGHLHLQAMAKIAVELNVVTLLDGNGLHFVRRGSRNGKEEADYHVTRSRNGFPSAHMSDDRSRLCVTRH